MAAAEDMGIPFNPRSNGEDLDGVAFGQLVVISAGTIESPRLLMLSGIGHGAGLGRLGIPVRVDLPGVGGNLHDHVLSPVIFAAAPPVPPAAPGLQHLHGQLFRRSRSRLVGPDIQPLFFHLPMYLRDEGMDGPPDGFTVMIGEWAPELVERSLGRPHGTLVASR